MSGSFCRAALLGRSPTDTICLEGRLLCIDMMERESTVRCEVYDSLGNMHRS
jgi:hypothetical protein